MKKAKSVGFGICVLLLSACAPEAIGTDNWKAGEIGKSLSTSLLMDRAGAIIDRVNRAGITNPQLFAGIAMAETGMAHCWSEATWACKGPNTDACGGPIISGSGDGPCRNQQGGLGFFQFDGGNHDETLAREGSRILSVDGSVDATVDFVVNMVIESTFIAGVSTREQAIAWINRVEIGSRDYNRWITTVVNTYNGCRLGVCEVYNQRMAHYDSNTRAVAAMFSPMFWRGRGVGTPTEPEGPAEEPEGPAEEPARPTEEPEAPDTAAGCTNTCPYANDGECDDGGTGADYRLCRIGTDCGDCGARSAEETAEDSSPPPERPTEPAGETCDPLATTSCSPGSCCGEMACRASVSSEAACCVEAADSCRFAADCCGYMDCNGGRCQARPRGRGCLDAGDCVSRICRSGLCG